MAEINEIIAKQAIEGLKEADKVMTDFDIHAMKTLETLKPFAELFGKVTASTKDYEKAVKATVESEKQYQQVAAKRVSADREAEKSMKRLIELGEKRAKKEEEHARALNLTVKSLNDAKAKIKAYTEELHKLDQTTKDGAKTAEKYKKIIADTDAWQKKNTDNISAQRLNIGNYKSALEGLGRTIAATFSVGAIISFGRAAFNAYEEQEVANRKLLYALGGNKTAFDKLSKSAADLQGKLGIPDETIMNLQMMAAATGATTEQIDKIVKASVTLSSVTGQDLDSAYKMLNASLSGNSKGLNRIDSEFTTLSKSQLKNGEAIDLVLNKYGSIAEKAVIPTSLLKTAWGEFMETLGSGEGGPINWAIRNLTKLVNILKETYEFVSVFGGDRKLMQETKDIQRQNEESLKRYEAQVNKTKKSLSKQEWQKAYSGQMEALNESIKKQEALAISKGGDKYQQAIAKENLNLLHQKKLFLTELEAPQKRMIENDEGSTKSINKQATAMESLTARITTLRDEIANSILLTGKAPDGMVRELLGSEAELKKVEDQVKSITTGLISMNGKKSTGITSSSTASPLGLTRRDTPSAFGASDPTKQGFNGFIQSEWGQTAIDGAKNTADAIMSIIDERDQAAFDKKMSRLEKEKEKKLSNTKLTEAQKAKIEADYEKKSKKLKEEQFKKQKAADIIQSIMNTAVSATKVLANPAQLAAVLIAGAAQTTVIAAQKVPEFDKGTGFSPSNFIAGENRPEWMITKGGNVSLVTRPTMFKNMAGATVISGEQTEKMLKAGVVPTASDYSPVIHELKDLKRTIAGKRELHISASGSQITEREGNYYKTYFNRRVKWTGKAN